jgi:phage N-6-adenine-methyltransferase
MPADNSSVSTLEAFGSLPPADTHAANGDGEEAMGSSPEVRRVPSHQGNDEYGTPRWLIRRLTDAVGGLFALDPAAGAEPQPIAQERYTKAEDGLSQDWTTVDGPIYLNPPYSDPYPWLNQLATSVDPDAEEGPDFGVGLTKVDTSTGWFHDHLTDACVLCLLTDRLSYHGGESSASFASGLSVFGDPPRALLETLGDIGALYTQVEVEAALEQQTFEDLLSDGGVASAALPVQTTAPATPPSPTTPGTSTEYVSLDFVNPWDELVIELETESLASRRFDLPEQVSVRVLRGGKSIDASTGTVTLDTVGSTPNGEDVCARIRNSAALVSHVDISLAVDMDRWVTVTPTAIRTRDRGR